MVPKLQPTFLEVFHKIDSVLDQIQFLQTLPSEQTFAVERVKHEVRDFKDSIEIATRYQSAGLFETARTNAEKVSIGGDNPCQSLEELIQLLREIKGLESAARSLANQMDKVYLLVDFTGRHDLNDQNRLLNECTAEANEAEKLINSVPNIRESVSVFECETYSDFDQARHTLKSSLVFLNAARKHAPKTARMSRLEEEINRLEERLM